MEKKRMKTLKRALLLSGAILVAAVGVTLAFYVSAKDADNTMGTKDSAAYLLEVFDKDDHWLPGETKEKIVQFGNQGVRPQVIRFRVIETWWKADGRTPWEWMDEDLVPIALNWTPEITGPAKTWTQLGDWYYYHKVLESGEETPAVLSSVTFSTLLANGGSAEDDFSDRICRLTVEMEAVDVLADITKEAWGVGFTGSSPGLIWAEYSP